MVSCSECVALKLRNFYSLDETIAQNEFKICGLKKTLATISKACICITLRDGKTKWEDSKGRQYGCVSSRKGVGGGGGRGGPF